MAEKRKLTVLMPVYNVEKYVREAMESMLNQTFCDFTLLVLDDCSTDRTAEIVQSFQDKRIVYYRHEKNVGLAENLNRGVELADTEYLARMDGDDISVATCLEKQFRFLEAQPEVDVCGVGFRFFGSRNETIIFPEHHADILAEQLFGNAIIQPMFRRRIFVDNGLRYKTSAFPAEDYRMWSECMQVARMHNLQEPLFLYRMHEAQISTEKRQFQVEQSDKVRFFMLEWLSPDFTNDEKRFFVEKFVPARPQTKQEQQYIQRFAELIEQRNETVGHFDAASLHSRLQKHLQLCAYYLALNLYFSNGFSLKNYLNYLFGGVACQVSAVLNRKILLKSILHKKK